MRKKLLIIALFCVPVLLVNAQAPVQVPVYSFWNSTIHRHFYTIHPGEVNSGEGWAPDYPPILGYLLSGPSGGPTVYRYNNPKTGAHYYTTGNTAPSGFVYESILGYVPGPPLADLGVPVYEYYNAGDYYYSQNGGGVDGYHLNGIAFYVQQ